METTGSVAQLNTLQSRYGVLSSNHQRNNMNACNVCVSWTMDNDDDDDDGGDTHTYASIPS